MKKAYKIVSRIILAIVLIPLVVVGLALVIMQTGVFKGWLATKIEKVTAENLNGTLEIGSLKGNFFTRLALNNVCLKDQKGDTLVYFSHLGLHYHSRELLNKTLLMEEVILESPDVRLLQGADSLWNFQRLVPPGEEEKPEKKAAPFAWKIRLDTLKIEDARIHIQREDSTLANLTDIDLIVSGRYQSDRQMVHLQHLGVESYFPPFHLEHLGARASLNQDSLRVDYLEIRTGKNSLDAKVKMPSVEERQGEGELAVEAIDISEFDFFFSGITLKARPKVDVNVYSQKDVKAVLLLEWNNEHIDIEVVLVDFWEYLKKQQTDKISYEISLNLEKFRLSNWFGDIPLGVESAQIEVKGEGLEPKDIEGNIESHFTNLAYDNYWADSLDVAVLYFTGKGEAQVALKGPIGLLNLEGKFSDLLGDLPMFELDLIGKDLNLDTLPGMKNLASDIDLSVGLKGQGNSLSNLVITKGGIYASPSRIAMVELDTLESSFSYADSTLFLKDLKLSLEGLYIEMRGEVGWEYLRDFQALIQMSNPIFPPGLAPLDSLFLNGNLAIRAEGPYKALRFNGEGVLEDIQFNELMLQKLQLAIEGGIQPGGVVADGDIQAWELLSGDLRVDSLFANLSVDTTRVQTQVLLGALDSLKVCLESDYQYKGETQLLLNELDMQYGRFHIQMSQPTMIGLSDSLFLIDHFELRKVGDNNSDSLLTMNGAYRPKGVEDIHLWIGNLDLKLLEAFTDLKGLNLGGKVDLEVNLKGTAQTPVVNGNLKLQQLAIENHAIGKITGEWEMASTVGKAQVVLTKPTGEELRLEGEIPILFSLDPFHFKILEDRPLKGALLSEGIPIGSYLELERRIEEAGGTLYANMTLGGTLKELDLKGYLYMRDGRLLIPSLGVDYNDMLLKISAENSRVVLDSLYIIRGKGKLFVKGEAQFKDHFLKGELKSTHIDLMADRFYVIRHHDYEVQIGAGLFMDGAIEGPEFGGEITVLRSSFNVPALMRNFKAASPEDMPGTPMLVEALGPMDQSPDQVRRDTTKKESDAFKSWKGKIKVSLPRNTWLKSNDMRIELAGDLDVVKEGEQMEIFGPIEIVRGYYDLFGKRFVFKEAEMLFKGGSEINPELDLLIEYVFRTPEREKKVITLDISGTAKDPLITFFLENEEISEADAVSYIVFGKSMDHLNPSEQSSMDSDIQAGAIAGTVVSGMLSNQMTKILGNTMKLDMIEVKASDDLKGAAFTVGKYLTNDLFISYQKNFGSVVDNELTPEIITLEYEINRNIFIQLLQSNARESGIDVFLKFEW